MDMRKILYRSRTDRWIAGVCGGLGDYFGVDANAVRLAFVVLALWQGMGLVLYLLMVIILPEEPVRELALEQGLPPVPPEDETQRRGRMLGAILVVGGAYLLIHSTDMFNTLLAERGLGVLLIAGGLVVLLLRSRRRGQ
jgi:phage shock protein PspC (stress-responsive transcriptional regulator)